MPMPTRRASLILVAGLVLRGPAVCMAQAPDRLTPRAPNIALHKPYTLEPSPNYGDCSLDPDRTLLTDGVTTQGYFWVQKTSVGWVNAGRVAITVDLGQVEPIAGLSYSTAAGVAGVTWPTSIWIMVSDDRKQWTVVGDLVSLSNRREAPPPKPYRLWRFATSELQARGRYVALVVDQSPYTVVDEIEVYRGEPAWLAVAPRGKRVDLSPLEYCRARRTLDLIQARMRADLDEACAGIGSANLGGAERAALRARAEELRRQVEAQDDVPGGFTTILPLNDLHARIYALNAPLLRARGYRALTVWSGYRYDPLQPMQAPVKPPGPPALRVRMMRNEHRAQVLNLTNATDGPLTATLSVGGLGRAAAHLSWRDVLFTDTRELTPVAAALAPARTAAQGLRVTVEPGVTRQVWLDLESRGLPAGDYRGRLRVSSEGGQGQVVVPLSWHVADLQMPGEFSVAIGGWDETNGRGGYDVTAQNMLPLIKNLRDHGVNMPWSNPQVMPTPGQYDAQGNMTAPPDFTAWDEWVRRWQGVQHWGLFPNVGKAFSQEPMGTPRFNKMVGAWVTAWVKHARLQGIKPGQIKVLLVDEPQADDQDQVIIAWARAIRAAQPEVMIWNDPVHAVPAKVAPQFYLTANVLSPNASCFLSRGQAYRGFFVAQRQAGRELWFYSCSGPSKLLDPDAYYRGQFWLNLRYGGRGSCYWAFGDEGGDSWNAYAQPRASYSPLFLSKTAVTDAKQMEAIREGAEDFEYFGMLARRVAELERTGARSAWAARAEALLVAGPERAVAIMGEDRQRWLTPKDRRVMERSRLQALDLLERPGKP